ncbi:MAG: PhzF family phenazine biosynthesis protein [Alphaproteobacteria bacterium]|nr:PhzF family phenazine biosynthesis protein [Alphaproteobacteria bacterium]
MPRFDFRQVDVFTTEALRGNPLAVVLAADPLDEGRMKELARWTNLSETTFLLTPTDAGADYRVRIFTPQGELPFAGHPTLGSCHVWLAAGGRPRGDVAIQQCGVGLVRVKRDGDRLAFAAPPLRRSGLVDDALVARIAAGLRIAPGAIRAAQWIDNGPGWVAVMLGSRTELLALRPDYPALEGVALGVVAPCDGPDAPAGVAFEVRAFFPRVGEDPVTGSLNAGLAQWLIGAGIAPSRYIASQGTAMGRAGRIHVERIGDDIWIGGHTVGCIEGTLTL